ncbi:hypothetical protein C2845_PM04G19210 [Panicum miliaceum]|uniref:Phytocyanin domain-containing protein n=1 Tax=Panicum miliaceum TaxID=4540 RepID=A0A3L6QRP6_PANMI|nr:hypothetical protein C2845_PM04G19210 [Panicum miliaceum]
MAAFRLAVLLLVASASRPPAVYGVGDETGWAVPLGSAAGALNEWAARNRFLVGDVLDFKYGDDDSVLLVLLGDYERYSAASPLRRFADGGGTRFALGRPGFFYFISGAPARCEAGQRMVVRVVDGARRPSLTSGAPTPAPGTQPSDTPPCGHRRLSLAQKQFAAAAIGLGAGFILIFSIVWLCFAVACCSCSAATAARSCVLDRPALDGQARPPPRRRLCRLLGGVLLLGAPSAASGAPVVYVVGDDARR